MGNNGSSCNGYGGYYPQQQFYGRSPYQYHYPSWGGSWRSGWGGGRTGLSSFSGRSSNWTNFIDFGGGGSLGGGSHDGGSHDGGSHGGGGD